MKQLNQWVGGPGDYLFIQCYRILGRRTCAFFGVKKHFAIFAFLPRCRGGSGPAAQKGAESPFRAENRLTVPSAQTI